MSDNKFRGLAWDEDPKAAELRMIDHLSQPETSQPETSQPGSQPGPEGNRRSLAARPEPSQSKRVGVFNGPISKEIGLTDFFFKEETHYPLLIQYEGSERVTVVYEVEEIENGKSFKVHETRLDDFCPAHGIHCLFRCHKSEICVFPKGHDGECDFRFPGEQ